MSEYDQTLRLDADGDVFLNTQRRAEMIGGHNAVVQELKILLKTVQGEDEFDSSHGLRLFETAGSPNSVLKREVRFCLQSDDRVESVNTIEVSDPDGTRQRDVAVNLSLINGRTASFGVQIE